MQKEVIIPIYDALVCLFVGATVEGYVKYLKDTYDIDETVSECRGFVNSQFSPTVKRKVFYMYVNPKVEHSNYINTIGHELFHLTQEILEDRGEFFKRRDANESYAYLQGFILGENYQFFEKGYNKFKRLK